MAKVTTVFTYTVPAVAGATVPPPAPINCGCNDFILILEDRSLLQTVLRGVLTTTIKEVAVSATPVAYVDPESGVSRLVWKYDYTLQYDTDDLTDPDYRIRRCDVQYNCCRSCAIEYADRRLESVINGISGACVDNTDPLNPIITGPTISGNIVTGGPCEYNVNQTITSLARIGASSSIRYINELGVNTDIDLCPIIEGCYSGVTQINPLCGISWNPATQELGADVTGEWGIGSLAFPGGETAGAEVYCASDGLRTHPLHRWFCAQTQVQDAAPAALAVAGHTRTSTIASFVLGNPSASRSLSGMVKAFGRAFGGLNANVQAELSFAVKIDNGTGLFATSSKRVALNSDGGPPNFRHDFELGWERLFNIPPGGSITIRAETVLTANFFSAGAQYGFDGPIDCFLTYVAHTE